MDSIIPSLLEKFNDAEIRIIEEENDIWIPIVDIASALSYDDRTMRKMLDRNVELFDGFNRGVTMTRRSDSQQNEVRCVNEQGFYMLISKIGINQIQDENVRNSVIEFNRWMVDTIKKVRESKNRGPTYGDYLKQEMIIVEELNRVLDLDKTLLTNVALENTEKYTGVSMLPYKQMLPAVKGIVAVLRATDIGNELNIPASAVNVILERMGYIVKEHKQWIITDKGKQFGKAYFESKAYNTGALWTGTVNKWSPEVVEQIREFLKEE